MFAARFGGIDLNAFCRREAEEMAGSESGFPTRAERKARKKARLAEIRFRMEKGYPVSMMDCWRLSQSEK